MSNWKPSYGKRRRYKIEWEEEFKWLALKDGMCYCKVCDVFIRGLKTSNFAQHANTSKHKNNDALKSSPVIFSVSEEGLECTAISSEKIDDFSESESNFPKVIKLEVGKSDGKRTYNRDWELRHSWLAFRDGLCYCKLCKSYLKACRKTSLILHEKSKRHRESMDDLGMVVKWEIEEDMNINDEVSLQNSKFDDNGLFETSNRSHMLPKASNLSPTYSFHGNYSQNTLKLWQSCGTEIHSHNIMYPLFITEGESEISPVKNLPGVFMYGIDKVCSALEPLVNNGLSSILLFGGGKNFPKDERASFADDRQNPVIVAIKRITASFPSLTVACDLCLCAYTIHSHCAILNGDRSINDTATLRRLKEIALAYVSAGAHILSPSVMMDGLIFSLKNMLVNNNLKTKVSILSNSVKFSSHYYHSFEQVTGLSPIDRSVYQIPIGSAPLALKAVDRDVSDGIDMLMITPALSSLDIIRYAKDKYPAIPLFAFQSTAEYTMLRLGAQANLFDMKFGVMESLTSIRRSGADVIVTYFAPLILRWLKLDFVTNN